MMLEKSLDIYLKYLPYTVIGLSVAGFVTGLCFFIRWNNKRRAEAYVNMHKNNFVSSNLPLVSKCNLYGNGLIEKNSAFLSTIRAMGLDEVCNCSSAVVSNSSNQPIKYLIKYSKVQETEEDLDRLDRCIAYTKGISVYYALVAEIYRRATEDFPKKVIKRIDDTKLVLILVDSYALAHKIFYPRFCFSYTSAGGRSVRRKVVTVNSEILTGIREEISGKMSKTAHVKRQRSAMTNDLREAIKKRDNYTCRICGNSVYQEPNLLLEVDHIIPVSKGGKTEASNLQTLCWRCNRDKGNKTGL